MRCRRSGPRRAVRRRARGAISRTRAPARALRPSARPPTVAGSRGRSRSRVLATARMTPRTRPHRTGDLPKPPVIARAPVESARNGTPPVHRVAAPCRRPQSPPGTAASVSDASSSSARIYGRMSRYEGTPRGGGGTRTVAGGGRRRGGQRSCEAMLPVRRSMAGIAPALRWTRRYRACSPVPPNRRRNIAHPATRGSTRHPVRSAQGSNRWRDQPRSAQGAAVQLVPERGATIARPHAPVTVCT